MKKVTIFGFIHFSHFAFARKANLETKISAAGLKIEPKVIEWRRDFHAHPELANQEVRTAAIIAKHLQSLGIEIKTGVATNGVVDLLKGDKPGFFPG